MSLDDALHHIRDFHTKHGCVSTHFAKAVCRSPRVDNAIISLQAIASSIEQYGDIENDPFELRTHLIAEETSEFLQACVDGDHVEMFDGLCDLLYVVLGTAVQFDMDVTDAFTKAFTEIVRSNSTKVAGDSRRVRDKGDEYSPPNLEGIVRDAVSSHEA